MRNVFHSAEIGGIQFQALVSADGPYIQSSPFERVAIGPSSICEIRAGDQHLERGQLPGWWVVKYENQPRIYLPNFDVEKATALSKEFGIPFALHSGRLSERASFDTSPACASLVQWVGKHPRLAQQYGGSNPYMAGLNERAKQVKKTAGGYHPK